MYKTAIATIIKVHVPLCVKCCVLLSLILLMVECEPEGSIKLTNVVNGTNAGIVEVCVNGTAGRIVDEEKWTTDDARVVCRQLGVRFGGKYQ